jgi:PAS domain S-box-containing protein
LPRNDDDVLLAAFEHAPSGVAVLTGDGRLLRVNRALARMLGRPAEELLRLRWQDVMHPDDRRTGEAAFARALTGTEAVGVEVRAPRPDGGEALLRVSAQALPAGAGEPARLVAHCEELSSRRSIPPRGLNGSPIGVAGVAALQAVVEGVAEAIVCVDSHDIVRFFSPAAERIWGRPAEEVVGRAVWSLAPDSRELWARELRAELRAGRSMEREAVASRTDGSHVGVRLAAVPIFGPNGTYEGAAITALDIPDRRRAHFDAKHGRQLRQRLVGDAPNVVWLEDRKGGCPLSNEGGAPDGVGLVASGVSAIGRCEADSARLAALVRAAPEGLVTTDRDAIIETWNPGAERMFGLPAEHAIGRGYDEVVVPEAERDASRHLRAQALAGQAITARMGGRRSDGSELSTQVSAAPLTAADGSHIGIVAIIRDVTQLVRAESELRERAQQLERSNADLEAFAYAASHEIQEPLRSIQMGAETVMRSAAERLHEDERGLLAYVETAASRMSAQVYALMEVARVALNHGPQERAPVQLALDDALEALRAAIQETGAEIDVQGELPSAPVPRAEMALVLQNLIANAIKFRRDDARPRVTVSGAVRDGHVEVSVGDNGIGLSEADREHIFRMFGRPHSGVPGTGMGLAVCRRILERRGASISVSSAGPDRGTQFTLRLPAAGS